MCRTTILYAHPWSGSFNAAILTTLLAELTRYKQPYHLIDLYRDNFNPVLSEAELALYSKGLSDDPLVKHYQQILSDTQHLFIVAPVWWHGLPAIVQGFFDKVLLINHAYQIADTQGQTGLLKQIKQASVIVTSSSAANGLDYLERVLSRTLNYIGIEKIDHHYIGLVDSLTHAERKQHLAQIASKIAPAGE